MRRSRTVAVFAATALPVVIGAAVARDAKPPAPRAVQEDARTPIVVPAEARAAVLEEMRQMLAALNGVLMAVVRKDPAGMAQAARSGGTAIAVDTDPAVAARLPAEFARLGMATHEAFDAVAEAADAGAPRDTVVARLGRLTGDCVACHETYRLEVEGTGGR